ncbi:DNA binding methylated-DNA--cysteine S-methyltransferase [Cystobasidium minutum MCA 4210]|uniref:DNA binding methylated-DNA--cysteine S-methyltransferase n=1 Tax=Cystobasidium minutum MCA 4210 TaxID=1397322 RepID=UPI0034CFD171|eukprot:jgi/Rhomi1/197319/gm1.5533_g
MRTRTRRSTSSSGTNAVALSSPTSTVEDDAHTIQRDFAASVWRMVMRIPAGRVTTYGHIAKQLGYPRHARMVGQSLKMLPPSRSSPLGPDGTSPNPDFVPWHRVVNAKGDISPRGNQGATTRQADMLEAEGVEYTMNGTDGLYSVAHIRLSTYGWFP